MKRAAVAAALVLLLAAACGGGPAPVSDGQQDASASAGPVDEATWAKLEAKPLQLAPLASGATCQLSTTAMLTGSATGLAFGDGPVYAVPGGPILVLEAKGSDGRSPAKLLWMASPDYRGPAVIRGARLDATGDVTFEKGVKTLRFDTQTTTRMGDATQGSALGWRYLPSVVSLTGPGCYGFQIDLPDKALTITLRAA